MSEASVHTARAVVYVVDPNTKSWAPIDSGFTRLDIYVHSGTGNARVIGRSMEDPNKILVNSNISKETMYTKARDTFHQWSDSRGAYGLNFGTAPEADAFAANFENSKNGVGAVAAQPQPPAPKPAPPPKPAAPVAPTPTPAQPKPAPPAPKGAPPPPAPPKAPPKPPPAPAASSSTPSSAAPVERNALLDSIQGFSKGGLKKTVTVDKSAPIVSNKPAAGIPSVNSLTRKEAASAAPGASPAAAAPAPAASGGNDMMAEMLRKREAMKSKQAAEPAAHKPAAALKPAAAPTPAAIARPPSQQMKPNPPPAGNKPTTGLQTAGSFGHGGANAVAAAAGGGGGASGASGASAPPSAGNGGAELPEHLQALKEAIMTEIRAELAQFKAEILESLQQR